MLDSNNSFVGNYVEVEFIIYPVDVDEEREAHQKRHEQECEKCIWNKIGDSILEYEEEECEENHESHVPTSVCEGYPVSAKYVLYNFSGAEIFDVEASLFHGAQVRG